LELCEAAEAGFAALGRWVFPKRWSISLQTMGMLPILWVYHGDIIHGDFKREDDDDPPFFIGVVYFLDKPLWAGNGLES